MTLGRRRFLQAMFGAACGVVIADDVLEALDAAAPRPVVVPGADLSEATYPRWQTNTLPTEALTPEMLAEFVRKIFERDVVPALYLPSPTYALFNP